MRVMSVMEGAVRNGFEERHLPDYMQSFCEVRLALTGPSTVLRSQEDISKVCLNFRTNLEHDLAESVTQQLEAEHRDGHQLSPRETDSPKRLADGSAKPVRIRLKSSEGHNATVHAFCMATSDCMGSARDRDATATLRGHPRNPAMSKCDICASSLMGKVADWRDAETLRLREGGVEDQLPFDGLLKKWCVDRLEQSWALRSPWDLEGQSCRGGGEQDHELVRRHAQWFRLYRLIFLRPDDARCRSLELEHVTQEVQARLGLHRLPQFGPQRLASVLLAASRIPKRGSPGSRAPRTV